MHIQALILAAGFSTRMQAFKPLLPLGGLSVLARCVLNFQRAGIDSITVVTGHRHQEIAEACSQLGVQWVHNPDPGQGMFSSVLTGLASLPDQAEAFFLLPVDIALVRPWSMRQTVYCADKEHPLVAYPCFQGRRGHPPLISTQLQKAIAEHTGSGGLRPVLQRFEDKALNVETWDRNVLEDMDRPEDLARAEHKVDTLGRLDREEAWALITSTHPISETGKAHAQAVACTAEALARALNRSGAAVDPDLSYVCGLVHDVAKGQPRHEEAGGKLLQDMGLDEMAPIVAAHRDVDLPEDRGITAKEVVYLADKLTRGPNRVSVRERFQEKLDLFSHDPEAVAAISRRLDNALAVQARMEEILDCSVLDVVPALKG